MQCKNEWAQQVPGAIENLWLLIMFNILNLQSLSYMIFLNFICLFTIAVRNVIEDRSHKEQYG